MAVRQQSNFRSRYRYVSHSVSKNHASTSMLHCAAWRSADHNTVPVGRGLGYGVESRAASYSESAAAKTDTECCDRGSKRVRTHRAFLTRSIDRDRVIGSVAPASFFITVDRVNPFTLNRSVPVGLTCTCNCACLAYQVMVVTFVCRVTPPTHVMQYYLDLH